MFYKYITRFLAAFALMISPAMANSNLSNAFTANTVGYKSCASFSSDIKFSEKPQYCINSEGRSVVSVMIKGQDIIGVSDDSLKANSIILNGKDLSKTRTGKDTYEMGSFPSVSENGAFVIFDVELETVPYGQLHNVRFDGVVDVQTSSKRVDLMQDVDVSTAFEVDMGPYRVEKTNATLMFGVGEDNLPVKVSGNLDAIISLKLVEGDQEIKSHMSTSFNDTKTFYFKNPKGSNVRVELQYWDNMQIKPVTFKF